MHRVGIIHTDIKPDNIVFLTGDSVTVREANAKGIFVDKVSVSRRPLPLATFERIDNQFSTV